MSSSIMRPDQGIHVYKGHIKVMVYVLCTYMYNYTY